MTDKNTPDDTNAESEAKGAFSLNFIQKIIEENQ